MAPSIEETAIGVREELTRVVDQLTEMYEQIKGITTTEEVDIAEREINTIRRHDREGQSSVSIHQRYCSVIYELAARDLLEGVELTALWGYTLEVECQCKRELTAVKSEVLLLDLAKSKIDVAKAELRAVKSEVLLLDLAKSKIDVAKAELVIVTEDIRRAQIDRAAIREKELQTERQRLEESKSKIESKLEQRRLQRWHHSRQYEASVAMSDGEFSDVVSDNDEA